MQPALAVCTLQGIPTNVALHRAIMAAPVFQAGSVDTRYLSGLLPTLTKATP